MLGSSCVSYGASTEGNSSCFAFAHSTIGAAKDQKIKIEWVGLRIVRVEYRQTGRLTDPVCVLRSTSAHGGVNNCTVHIKSTLVVRTEKSVEDSCDTPFRFMLNPLMSTVASAACAPGRTLSRTVGITRGPDHPPRNLRRMAVMHRVGDEQPEHRAVLPHRTVTCCN